MSNNPKAQNNLRPFPKGVSGNPNGRPRSLAKLIKSMPDEAQQEVCTVLYHAITLRNESEARQYLEQAGREPVTGRYGLVFQLAVKSLTGPHGWETLNDILDRLFGKPRLQVEAKPDTNRMIIIVDEAAKRAADKWSAKAPSGPTDMVVHVNSQDEAERLRTIGE